jgi:hypothetical protein
MDIAKQKRRTESILRWSPVLLIVSCLLFLVSLKFAPLSLRYSTSHLIIGAGFALAVVWFWRFDAHHDVSALWGVLVGASWVGAHWLLQEWVFHGATVSTWLEFQAIAAAAIGLFAPLSIFRKRIRQFVFDDAEQIVGREPR